MKINGQSISFFQKRPGNGRATFSILKRVKTDSDTKYSIVENKSLNSINASFLEKKITEAEARSLIREIVNELYKEISAPLMARNHNAKNEALFEEYWTREYADRDLVDEASIKNDFKRAIQAVGPLSIQSDSKEALQKQIKSSATGNKQRRVVSRINTLLSFCNRPFKLKKDKEIRTEVAKLSIADFKKVIKFVADPNHKLIFEVAFYTGLRVGEIFAIKPIQIKDTHIFVQTQIDRALNNRDTKTRRERKAYVIQDGMSSVKDWVKLADKNELRNVKLANILKEACKKAFPKDKAKWIKLHDLRHSYAIHLLSKGVSLSLVAQALGNSVVVCQKHYAGFTLSDEAIETIDKVMNG